MRLVLTKDIPQMREASATKIDALYACKIAAALGPVHAIHALKRQQALAGLVGGIVTSEEDRELILERAREQDDQLAKLDAERRAAKAALHKLTTVADIEMFTKGLEA